jgi:hypothetical protein
MLDPFAGTQKLSKPPIAVVHGDTWNMGHELHLVADIWVASADVRFGQDEKTHGRFPGGGLTVLHVFLSHQPYHPQQVGTGTSDRQCTRLPGIALARCKGEAGSPGCDLPVMAACVHFTGGRERAARR